jgi:hypothetical protein
VIFLQENTDQEETQMEMVRRKIAAISMLDQKGEEHVYTKRYGVVLFYDGIVTFLHCRSGI